METKISFSFKDKSFKAAINHFSQPANSIIDNTEKKEKWLKILQLFFYSDKIDPDSILMNKVLTYLYTGKLGDGSRFNLENNEIHLKDISTKNMVSSYLQDLNKIADLKHKKKFFLNLYKLYLDILHIYFSISKATKTYGKILIYEAPPFKKELLVVDHFLLNGGTYLNAIIEASPGQDFSKKMKKNCNDKVDKFVKDFQYITTKIKPELNDDIQDSISELFNTEALNDPNKENERTAFTEKLIKMYTEVYPNNQPTNFSLKILTYLTKNKKTDVERFRDDEKKTWDKFFNTLKTEQFKSIENKKEDLLSNLEKAVTSEIVYIDLILAPIHIDSELRKAWSTKDEFLFEGKTLPVLLFEWAIEHFKHEIRGGKTNTKQLVSTNCLIAFGTPLNTSVSIYEHFADKMFLIDTYGSKTQRKENHIDLTQLNSPVAFRKFKNRGQGVVFPMFKSNVIGGSRYPDSMLVKHAFDIEDKEKT